MYTENHLINDHHIDQMASQTDSIIANYKRIVSRLSVNDISQQQSLHLQAESAWQHITGHLDKCLEAKESLMHTITTIEQDYGKLCDDMTNINSNNARAQYDQAISQLENTHRQKLSLYELIAANVSKLECVVSSGHSSEKVRKPIPLKARRSISKDTCKKSRNSSIANKTERDNILLGGSSNKPIVDKDLNDLYELDLLRKGKSDSSKFAPELKEVNAVTPDIPADEITNPEQNPSVWKSEPNTVCPVTPETGGFLPPKAHLDSVVGKMEDVQVEKSYRVLDYAPEHVDAIIDYTHSLTKHLKDFCDHLGPIPSLDRINIDIEDEYATKEEYQQHLYNALGLLHEYLASAKSELRWIENNKKLAKEKSSLDSKLPLASENTLIEHEKLHTATVKKIDTELQSLQSRISYFDQKSLPHRNPKRSTRYTDKDEATESIQLPHKTKLSNKETGHIEFERGPASRRSIDSAIYSYRYKSWRDAGTKELLSATEKCIEHLLRFNAVLPVVDMNGYSECIQAENQYALKEKHKLDLLQMIGHLNAHLSELYSQINKFQLWLSNPAKSDDPRYDWKQKQQELNEKLLSYNRLSVQIEEMIERSHRTVIEVDQKLWPGEKPREKFDQQEPVFLSLDDIHYD